MKEVKKKRWKAMTRCICSECDASAASVGRNRLKTELVAFSAYTLLGFPNSNVYSLRTLVLHTILCHAFRLRVRRGDLNRGGQLCPRSNPSGCKVSWVFFIIYSIFHLDLTWDGVESRLSTLTVLGDGHILGTAWSLIFFKCVHHTLFNIHLEVGSTTHAPSGWP